MTSAPADRLCLGWQYATPCQDPGPPPRRPTPPEAERLNPEWAAAQRREERRLNRPLWMVVAAAAVIGLLLLLLGTAGWINVLVAGVGVICCALIAGVGGYAIWQGERALRSRMAQERARVSKLRAVQEGELRAWQEEHARQVRDWQARRVAYEHQKRWYAVYAPDGARRVDVAGGTLSGWSAMLTTVGAHRLAAGGEVTVIDLSGDSVALDLLGFARAFGIEPLVRMLPDDLPRLGLGPGPDALAGVLSLAVSGSEDDQDSARILSLDHAILERVIDVLGATATVASVAAALRALARVGDPRDDVASGLISAAQADRLGAVFGRGSTDHVILERAWVLESRLRKLAPAGPGPTTPAGLPRGPLRVIALSQRVGPAEGTMLGTYLTAALTHALHGTPPGRPWRHTLFVLGADRLRGETLDRLGEVCESTGTGLVLTFRAIPPRVKPRLGRGNAAVALMRLPNAEEAKAVSEQLGTEPPFRLAQLTETIGPSVTDTAANSYTSTADSAVPAASADRARDSESVSAAVSGGTAWGTATAKAAGDAESFARAMQRSREFQVGQRELEQLPPSAVIISYAGPGGRQVVLADVNPGIGGLSAATELTLEEFRTTPAVTTQAAEGADGRQDAARPDGSRPRPNLGPPPARLDWRRRRS